MVAPSSVQRQLDLLRKQDVDRNVCLKDLIKVLKDFQSSSQQMIDDLEEEKDVHQSIEDTISDLELKYSLLDGAVRRSAHVLVLIDADADAYVFANEYLDDPFSGGQRAAQALKKAVQEQLGSVDQSLESLPIHVRAFANTDGLSKALGRSGTKDAAANLARLVQGFNLVKFCEFVSVGSGKDKADEKIKTLFESSIANPTCSHIVFGACHDNGYVRVLEQLYEPGTKARVSLLTSFETGSEFFSLDIPRIKTDGVFRTENLSKRPVLYRQSSGPSNRARSATLPPAEPIRSPNLCELPATKLEGPNFLGILAIEGYIFVNSLGLRLDYPVPECRDTAAQSLVSKLKKGKFCNGFVIGGVCPFPDRTKCQYRHNGLSAEEIDVLRVRKREDPCHVGLFCQKPSCFYGHQCPQAGCSGDKGCRFVPSMHVVLRTGGVWVRRP